MKKRIISIATAFVMVLLAFSPITAEKAYADEENAIEVPVLVYHAIGPHDQGKLQVSAKKFEKQLKWIQKCGYTTLTMEEFVEWYEGKRTIPAKSVLITFDDGDQCVVKYAVPLLQKYNMHATMFVVGSWVGNKGFVKKSTIYKLKYGNVIDIESHGYALHNRDNYKTPAKKWSQAKLKADCDKMTMLYGCTVLCYPWGATSRNLMNALEETGVYRAAFTFARANQYQGAKNRVARRTDYKYTIPRITISGKDPWTSIKKWVKP